MYFPNESITTGDQREEVLGEAASGGEESPASEGVAASEGIAASEGVETNKGFAGQPRVPPESEPCGEGGVSCATPGNIQPKSTTDEPKELQPLQQPNKLLQPLGY